MSAANLTAEIDKIGQLDPNDYKIGIIQSILSRRQNGEDTPSDNSDSSSEENFGRQIRIIEKVKKKGRFFKVWLGRTDLLIRSQGQT